MIREYKVKCFCKGTMTYRIKVEEVGEDIVGQQIIESFCSGCPLKFSYKEQPRETNDLYPIN